MQPGVIRCLTTIACQGAHFNSASPWKAVVNRVNLHHAQLEQWADAWLLPSYLITLIRPRLFSLLLQNGYQP